MSASNSTSDKSIDNSAAKSKKNRRRVLGVSALAVAALGVAATVGGAYYQSDVVLHGNKLSTASWGLQVDGSTNPTVGLDIEGVGPGVSKGDSFTVTNTSDSLDQEISVTGIGNIATSGGAGLGASAASSALVKVTGTNGFTTGGYVPVTSFSGPVALGTAVHGTTTTYYVDVELDPSVTDPAFAGASATFDLTVHAAQKH